MPSVTAARSSDCVTFDTALRSASQGTHFNIYDAVFFFGRYNPGGWQHTPSTADRLDVKDKWDIFTLLKCYKPVNRGIWTTNFLPCNIRRIIK